MSNRGGQLYSLDVSTGKSTWVLPIYLGKILDTPALSHDGSTLYVVSHLSTNSGDRSYLNAVSTRTGLTKWIFSTCPPPPTRADEVYLTAPTLSADGQTGETIRVSLDILCLRVIDMIMFFL